MHNFLFRHLKKHFKKNSYDGPTKLTWMESTPYNGLEDVETLRTVKS